MIETRWNNMLPILRLLVLRSRAIGLITYSRAGFQSHRKLYIPHVESAVTKTKHSYPYSLRTTYRTLHRERGCQSGEAVSAVGKCEDRFSRPSVGIANTATC